jgi:TPR repeat protein
VVEQDYEQALYWYTLAGEQGDEDAQYFLGRMHEKGEGIEKDLLLAVSLYMSSAKNGHKRAKNRLSELGYTLN